MVGRVHLIDCNGNKKPRTWRGMIGVRLFCREIDGDYSTPPDGFEPSTDCLEGSCSIQLS